MTTFLLIIAAIAWSITGYGAVTRNLNLVGYSYRPAAGLTVLAAFFVTVINPFWLVIAAAIGIGVASYVLRS